MLIVFAEHNARSTQLEQSERKANSFKIGGEITRNWRPFKYIITSLFPQREVRGWGSVLIRTGDELAIKLLSQALHRIMQCVCAACVCVLNLSARTQELIIPEEDYESPVSDQRRTRQHLITQIPT